MKILNTVCVSLLVFQIAWGRTTHSVTDASSPQSTSTAVTKQYPNAKTQANQFNDAVLSGDYAKAADLTYPKLVELIGGRAKYLAALKHRMTKTQSNCFRIISTVADDPTDIIEVGNDVYAIVPTTMKVKVPEGVFVGKWFMIGISNDRGEHWTFADNSSGFKNEQLKNLFPAVADRLRLPETERLVLQRAP
jgi:hypothetical protein